MMIVLAFLVALMSFSSVYSQDLNFPPDRVKASLAPHLQKIDGHLRQTLEAMRDAGITEENVATMDVKRRFSTPIVAVDDSGRFHVYIRMKAIDEGVIAEIESFGAKVEYTNSSWSRIVAWVLFTRIEQIAKLEIVTGIDNVDKPYVFTGEVNTAGDAIMKADQARNTFGVNGSGIKVGVISDGVDNWTASVPSGDLPSWIQIINNRIGGNEGTAMLEIVYDIAPGSNLAFADAGTSEEDFANNIDLLRNAGAKIIVDDIAYFAEPAFEDGVISQRVDNAVANGVAYIAAAGNQGDRTWDGQFKDSDGDGWHEFSGTDEGNAITFSSYTDAIVVTLQWANKWGQAGDDYDLYLYDSSGNLLALSNDRQSGNGNPYEAFYYMNDTPPPLVSTAYIKIKKYSGSPRELKVLVFPYSTGVGTLNYKTDYGIFHHAAASSCISVGANPASNPEYIEYFSSHGPSRIYTYDAQGQPISYVDRATPSQVGIDGVETKTGRLGYFPNPFYGTSAAAPHVAGITALILSLNPQISSTQIKSVTESTADKVQGMGGQNFTNQYGYGRTNAYQACLLGLAYANKSWSSIATAYNSGRRLVRDSSGKYYLVFESGGEIFYRRNQGAPTWDDPVRLSSGDSNNKYPSITGTTSKQFVVWQRYTGYTGGQHKYDTYFAKNTGSGWTTAKLTQLSDLAFSTQTNPQPVITYTTNQQGTYRVLVCARTSSGIKYVASTNDGGAWSSAALIPDASSSHRNQSLSMGPTTPPLIAYIAYDDGSNIYL